MTHLKSALLVIGSGSSSVTAHSFLVFFDGDDRLNDVVLPQEGAVAGRGVGLSAIARPGGRRDLPRPRRWMRIASFSAVKYGESPCRPGLVSRATGRQRRSAAR
jgi:hypothetical protein